MSIEKREHARRTIHVTPKGPLNGHEFEMHRASASEWIRVRREGTNGDLIELALASVIDSSLPDGWELDVDEAIDLMDAWITAHKDAAVPPA